MEITTKYNPLGDFNKLGAKPENFAGNPPRLVTSQRILSGSISFSKRSFGSKASKAKEVRLRIHFVTASTAGNPAPVSMPHSLGYVPTHWDVVHVERDPAAGPPGVVSAIHPFASSSRATFLCSTPNTWAEIILR